MGTVSRSPLMRLGSRDAHPLHAVTAVELHALARDVAQLRQDGARRVEQRIRGATGEFRQRGARAPAPVGAAPQEPVDFEADGEAMRGGARQARSAAEFREPARFFGDGLQYGHRLVEHTDTALLV